MSSSRLILIFLGFIFLAIVLLSSSRISSALRTRFSGIFPSLKLAGQATPTPAPKVIQLTPTPSAIPADNQTDTGRFTNPALNTKEIPATGPNEAIYLLLGGSALIGTVLKKAAGRL